MKQELSVKTVARLSGLSPHTLRAWEKRYGAVHPERAANGRRYYTKAQVERLRLLQLLVNDGHSIGQIASLQDTELLKLAESLQESGEVILRDDAESELAVKMRERLALLKSLQLRELIDRLELDERELSAKDFLLHIVGPLLQRTGALVAEGKLDIAHEHLLSAVLRHQLGEILHSLQRRMSAKETFPIAVLATTEGNLHEFGILIAAILAAINGFEVHYLGPNLPAESLIWAAESLKANVAIIGTSLAEKEASARSHRTYFARLASMLPPTCELWFGGPAARRAHQLVGRNRSSDVLLTLDALERKLALKREVFLSSGSANRGAQSGREKAPGIY